jgi:hypothetical protein
LYDSCDEQQGRAISRGGGKSLVACPNLYPIFRKMRFGANKNFSKLPAGSTSAAGLSFCLTLFSFFAFLFFGSFNISSKLPRDEERRRKNNQSSRDPCYLGLQVQTSDGCPKKLLRKLPLFSTKRIESVYVHPYSLTAVNYVSFHNGKSFHLVFISY